MNCYLKFNSKLFAIGHRQQCDKLLLNIFHSQIGMSVRIIVLVTTSISDYWMVFFGYGTHITVRINIFIRELHLSHCSTRGTMRHKTQNKFFK